MGTTELVNLILAGINAIVQVIASIKGQSGQTDDAIAAQTLALLTANDALYASLKAVLAQPTTPAAK